MIKNKILHVLLIVGILVPVPLLAAGSLDISITPEVEVNLQQYVGTGDGLLLWLPSESGLLEQERRHAQTLAAAGYSVWFADVLSAWFLPNLQSSIEQLPAAEIATLVEKVRLLSKKKVYLVASGRGALLSLRVARAWQQRYGKNATLGGTVLISPKLFIETPEPGMQGELMPIVSRSNLPIFILQPANSPWRWKLDRIVPVLELAGSDVYTRVLPNVRDRFYYRQDASSDEDSMAQRLPVLLRNAIDLLASFNSKPRLLTTQTQQQPVAMEGKKERELRAYQGDPQPPALQLENLQGQAINLADFRGKLVLVNFWASWCPPCVHEMPSMQKLADHFSGQPFEILAVNMAEDKQTVQRFLREKVQVRFPILMDVDGQALKRWQVFAFPTSYLVDKQGRIRLALFGAIDWMQEDVLRKLEQLLKADNN